jgi:ATP-dependent Lon protease
MSQIFNEKILFFKQVIDDIQIGLNKYRLLDIINNNEYNFCLDSLEKIINTLNIISDDNIVNELQNINTCLSSIIKNYGIYNLDNFIKICLGNDYVAKKVTNNNNLNSKYDVIRKYLHPINYKILTWNEKQSKLKKKMASNSIKEISKNKILDDKILIEEADNLECFDIMRISTNFYLRIYGVKVLIHDIENKKSLLVNCIVDDVLINNIELKFLINNKKNLLIYLKTNNLHKNDLFNIESWNNYYNNLNIKDFLIYNEQELFNKYIYIITQITSFEQKTINALVQEFIGSELFTQRTILIQLLLNNHKQEFQYIAYLLYDLLSNDNDTSNDSNDQKIIYNSLPWNCKKFFKDAMCKTIEYTSNLSNFDNNKIPLEQQICLMKVDNNIKEKAMQKLKEIKSKSEDSGSKARQYLDGLLKIPFGIYKEEFILHKKVEINELFNNLLEPVESINNITINSDPIKEIITIINNILYKDYQNYNSIQIVGEIDNISQIYYLYYEEINNYIINETLNLKKAELINIITSINILCKKYEIKEYKITSSDKIISIKNIIKNFYNANKSNNNLIKELLAFIESTSNNKVANFMINFDKTVDSIALNNHNIVEHIKSFNTVLDSAIYGHQNAKKQIERIIGQWINGENTGYCFGFEGPPGLGKTSLAKKGLSNCLKDKDGNSRPFAFIALGGSSNGSILDGHNYTYVGSTWGKIVDILIDKKCMNPIIFIDELDKVSNTEHGKEIIGILTHLIDSTQNDTFQDKYFSNIDLNLSKALFIFSYNDVELIDKILLDRIHRIKFDNLFLDEKIVITKDYLLPELYKTFGLNNILSFDPELIKYTIENYTNEPGVRKLKEILFEIISTINLDLLKKESDFKFPIIISKELISTILHDKHLIRYLKINNEAKVGIVNGLWANAYGNSGILHIESRFFISSTFLELKLTGMQGTVMKESMEVAKTLALSLLTEDEIKSLMKHKDETKLQGIHIHVPEGATPKDGPSAGAAITLVLYSLLTNRKIRNDYAITGETCLQGSVTAIGGLDLKILGGIKAGVKSFLYPKENAKDFKLFCDKHGDKIIGYNFYEIENIKQVVDYLLIKE